MTEESFGKEKRLFRIPTNCPRALPFYTGSRDLGTCAWDQAEKLRSKTYMFARALSDAASLWHVWRLLLCSQRLLSVTCFANSKTSMCGSVGSAGNGELRMIQGVLCCEACEQRHQSEWLRTIQKLRFSQYCQRPCCAELRAASGAHSTCG